jgi:hypothetical protein
MLLITSLPTALALVSLASCVTTYEPEPDFHGNRKKFYAHEASVATRENAIVKNYTSDNLRISHFDAHWRGITVRDYLSIARETKSDIIIARGVPERDGSVDEVRRSLKVAGFGETSIVTSPSGSLTSGIVIGVKGQRFTLESPIWLTEKERVAAVEVPLVIPTPQGPQCLHLIILTLDAYDAEARLRQLNVVQERTLTHEKTLARYIVLGGFHGKVMTGASEIHVLNKPEGLVTNAFSVINRPSPNYTSWLGVFSDTALVSRSLHNAIRDINVWHTDRADCLPILLDISLYRLTSFVEGRLDQKHSKNWDWRMISATIAGIFGIGILVIIMLKYRGSGSTGKRVRVAGFTDADIKISQRQSVSEEYPREKE